MVAIAVPLLALRRFHFDGATSAFRGEGAAPTEELYCGRPALGPMPLPFVPTPSRGEGWGGGDSLASVETPAGGPLSLTLMELLATRLSPQAGKSMVIPHEGGGDQFVAMPSFRRMPESSAFIKLDPSFRRDGFVLETTP